MRRKKAIAGSTGSLSQESIERRSELFFRLLRDRRSKLFFESVMGNHLICFVNPPGSPTRPIG
jgi:hypothetical protein